MIQITAYLRNEEDLAKWKLLENKTEWLHNQLADATTSSDSSVGLRLPPVARKPKGSSTVEMVNHALLKGAEHVQPPNPIEKRLLESLTTADKIKSNGSCKKCGGIKTSFGKCLTKGCPNG